MHAKLAQICRMQQRLPLAREPSRQQILLSRRRRDFPTECLSSVGKSDSSRRQAMLGGGRAAFSRAFASPEFWADVREKGSLFVRVACLVHVVRTYGIEATAVSADVSHLRLCSGTLIPSWT